MTNFPVIRLMFKPFNKRKAFHSRSLLVRLKVALLRDKLESKHYFTPSLINKVNMY